MRIVNTIEIIEETPEVVGTRFREYIKEKSPGHEMCGVITACEKNSRLAFHLEGDFNTADVEFTLVAAGNATRLTQTADVSFGGVVKVMSIAMAPAFKKKILKQSREEFERLKRLCESA